jgi:hypothetical protein
MPVRKRLLDRLVVQESARVNPGLVEDDEPVATEPVESSQYLLERGHFVGSCNGGTTVGNTAWDVDGLSVLGAMRWLPKACRRQRLLYKQRLVNHCAQCLGDVLA